MEEEGKSVVAVQQKSNPIRMFVLLQLAIQNATFKDSDVSGEEMGQLCASLVKMFRVIYKPAAL